MLLRDAYTERKSIKKPMEINPNASWREEGNGAGERYTGDN